jgi:hypothetical protein
MSQSSASTSEKLQRGSQRRDVASEGYAWSQLLVACVVCADLDSAHGGVPWLWSRQCGRGAVLQRVRH